MFATPLTRRILHIVGLTAALAAIQPVVLQAQEAPKKEISDKVSEGLAKLREMTEAKDYAGALGMINGLLVTAKPESYDLTILSQIKVQILLTESKYAEAIAPLETALRLGKAYDFIGDRQYLEFTQILSQLYFQEATSTKDVKIRADYLDKAYRTIKIYLRDNKKPVSYTHLRGPRDRG